MCASCGCGIPFLKNDPRAITYGDLAQAATDAEITVPQVVANLAASVDQVESPQQSLDAIIQRPTILSDIDGVLGFLTETIVTALDGHFGLGIVVSDMDYYWIEDTLAPDQQEWLIQQFQRGVFYANVAPDYAAIAALNAIHAGGYEVIVSSDRPPATTRLVTEQWLDKWRVAHDEIILRGKGGKLSIAEEHGPGDPLILIDDDPRKMQTVPRPGVEVWAPQRPWTPKNWRDYDGVWVFEQWADVLKRLGLPTDVPVPQFSRCAGPAVH